MADTLFHNSLLEGLGAGDRRSLGCDRALCSSLVQGVEEEHDAQIEAALRCAHVSPSHRLTLFFWRIGTRSAPPTRHRCRQPRARPPRSGGPGPSARSVALAAPPFVSGSGGRDQSRCRMGRPAESVSPPSACRRPPTPARAGRRGLAGSVRAPPIEATTGLPRPSAQSPPPRRQPPDRPLAASWGRPACFPGGIPPRHPP